MQNSKFMSVAQTADYLGVSTKTVRRYISSGRLTAGRLGPKLIRIPVESVERLTAHMQPVGAY